MAHVKTLVDSKIADKKVIIFSKSYCPFCTKAKHVFLRLIEEGKLSSDDYEVMEIENNPDCDAIQNYLQTVTGARSVPRVFINGKCIGGGDDVVAADKAGELVKKLLSYNSVVYVHSRPQNSVQSGLIMTTIMITLPAQPSLRLQVETVGVSSHQQEAQMSCGLITLAPGTPVPYDSSLSHTSSKSGLTVMSVVYGGFNGYDVTSCDIIISIIQVVMAGWIIGLNSLVLDTLIRLNGRNGSRDPTDVLLASLSITDILSGVFILHTCIYSLSKYQNTTECLVRMAVFHGALYSSIFHLIILTSDRYIKILFPYR
ncbi:hypothetical protein C0Q70_19698 [Pomacea canaliculata]|uniref:G-protein coupled receptors family 1 profile domain-containing protein n=1 Tax=Pomacea canaliculata TaxID=400727 RepID=A0A2T7NDG9_POMCA|nr:hypothetical protein C0Q70_19698 [Pomacea canaliculata]